MVHNTPRLESDMLRLPPTTLNTCQMMLSRACWILCINDKKRLFEQKWHHIICVTAFHEGKSIPREERGGEMWMYIYTDGSVLTSGKTSPASHPPPPTIIENYICEICECGSHTVGYNYRQLGTLVSWEGLGDLDDGKFENATRTPKSSKVFSYKTIRFQRFSTTTKKCFPKYIKK